MTNDWGEAGYNYYNDAADPNDKVLGHHLSLNEETFLARAWSFNANSPINGSVSVADGLGFFADQAGEVFAINMVTGLPAWTYAISDDQPVSTTPAITQTSLVLVGGQDGNLTAIHEFSGALAWSTSIGGQLSSPSVFGGTAYVTSSDGTVSAVNVTTGEVTWSVSLGSTALSGVAIDPALGLIFVGGSNASVTALNVSNGTTAWSTSVGGAVTATPVIGQNDVFVSSLDDTLYAFKETSGTPEWTYDTGGSITASVADVQSNLIVGSSDGSLNYLTPSTGKPTYHIVLGQPVVGIAGADNFVASVGSGGDILGSKPAATNPHAWKTTQGTALDSAPTVVNGEVIVAGENGQVVVYTPPGSSAY